MYNNNVLNTWFRKILLLVEPITDTNSWEEDIDIHN